MYNNSFPESNLYYFFFNSKNNSNPFKSSSKRNNTSKDKNNFNSKNKKLFSSSSYNSNSSNINLISKSKSKEKEKALIIGNNMKSDDLDLNENDSLLSFSKLKDINSSEFYSDGMQGTIRAKKVINRNKKKDIKVIISNDKVIAGDFENNENININVININKKRKRKRPTHTDLYSDNRKEKIKTSFFNSIFNMVIDDLKKFKKIKPKYIIPNIEKIKPILDSFKKDENFQNALSQKVKNIFYTDESLEKYFNKSFIKKKDFKNISNELILKNKNNKEIIDKIEEICQKLNEEKNKEIKAYSLKLNEIFNIKLKDIYLQYISNKKYFTNFNTLENEIENQRKKGKDYNYLKLFKQKAFDLCKGIK